MGKYLTRTAFSIGLGFAVGLLASSGVQAVGEGSAKDQGQENSKRAMILQAMAAGECTQYMDAYNEAVQEREDAEAVEEAALEAWYECELNSTNQVANTSPTIGSEYSVLVKADR